ncbi:MAG: DUF192 domain-containing protein [Myxococcota bacterium]|nr:DUF192 domain-containing protein [Myxococcota bacterium]
MARTFLVLTAALLLSSCASTQSASGLPEIAISVGGKTIRAEVAQEPASMARGLMYRREMDWNRGMLFVYQQDRILSFWMQNTFIPLSIAFLDSKGRILHITDMQPQTTVSHRSPVPARYALEMNQGWFDKAGVKVGDQAEFTLPDP